MNAVVVYVEPWSAHYQIHLTDDADISYRAAVNVQSQQAPSELLYLADDDLRHPITAPLAGLTPGWHPLPPRSGGPNLDFIRGNLFDPADMRALPPERPGVDHDTSAAQVRGRGQAGRGSPR